MTSILVVCTGNVCRSPIAEGLLRDALARRFGDRAPSVSSAGTAGWEGSEAMPESVRAALELGIDITAHRGRRLSTTMLLDADLVLCMAAEHRDALIAEVPEAAGRTFTLKELVRLLEPLPQAGEGAAPWTLAPRVARAASAREANSDPPHLDEDVADPLGQPLGAFRAVAWELEQWVSRLVDGLFGPVVQIDPEPSPDVATTAAPSSDVPPDHGAED
jgi:protein-tyrosine phosphatase